MSRIVSSVTSRKYAFTLPSVWRLVSTFAAGGTVFSWLRPFFSRFGGSRRLHYRRTCKGRYPVVQQHLALKLSAGLQTRRHIRNLQAQASACTCASSPTPRATTPVPTYEALSACTVPSMRNSPSWPAAARFSFAIPSGVNGYPSAGSISLRSSSPCADAFQRGRLKSSSSPAIRSTRSAEPLLCAVNSSERRYNALRVKSTDACANPSTGGASGCAGVPRTRRMLRTPASR